MQAKLARHWRFVLGQTLAWIGLALFLLYIHGIHAIPPLVVLIVFCLGLGMLQASMEYEINKAFQVLGGKHGL